MFFCLTNNTFFPCNPYFQASSPPCWLVLHSSSHLCVFLPPSHTSKGKFQNLDSTPWTSIFDLASFILGRDREGPYTPIALKVIGQVITREPSLSLHHLPESRSTGKVHARNIGGGATNQLLIGLAILLLCKSGRSGRRSWGFGC
jgi:hypothetical protein